MPEREGMGEQLIRNGFLMSATPQNRRPHFSPHSRSSPAKDLSYFDGKTFSITLEFASALNPL
jgi:hypothetical protein